MIIHRPTPRPQVRSDSNALLASLPGPAASRRAWASLLASWQVHQADLATADTEREIDSMLVRQIDAARRRLLTGRTRAERTMASNAMRLLSAARISNQTPLERGLA